MFSFINSGKWKSKNKALLVVSILFILFSISPNGVTQISAYSVIVDNAVDADSNEDGVSNVGNSSGAYTDAQLLDGTYQNITETDVGVNIEDFHADSGTDNDNITDTQLPIDSGTYSDYTNWNTSDNIYNTLTEENVITNNDEDNYDQINTDVDASADVGTETSPTQANDSVNGLYMTIQEANQGNAGVNEWINPDGSEADIGEWTSTGTSPWIDAQDEPTNYISESTNGALTGWFSFGSTSASGSGLTVNMSVYHYSSGDGYPQWEIDWTGDGTADASGSFTHQDAYAYENTGTISGLDTATEINAARVRFICNKGAGAPDTSYIDHVRLGVFQSASTDYELDFEYRWDTADFDDAFEVVSIYVLSANQSTENLVAYEWTGSDWSSLGTLSSDGWNNFTVSYLTSATYTIRIIDSDQASDGTQDSWDIDLITLHTWDETNKFDREIHFNGLNSTQYSVNHKYICFELGTFGQSSAETLNIDVWNGTSLAWENIGTIDDADENSWKNISLGAYFDSSSISFRVVGTSETSDSSQDTYAIDSCLLHTWSGAWLTGWNYRKKIIINPAAGAGTNYTIRIDGFYEFGDDYINNSISPAVAYIYFDQKSLPDFGDVRFTASDGMTELDFWIEDNLTASSMIHFADNGRSIPVYTASYPSVLFYSGTYNRTYFTWQAEDNSPDPYITYWDHDTNNFGPQVKVYENIWTVDDAHGGPAIAIDGSGYIHVFFGSHNSDQKHAKSDSPEDITSFTLQTDPVSDVASYPHPIMHSNGSLYLFYRVQSGNYHRFGYKKSDDGGLTWGAEKIIIDMSYPYSSYVRMMERYNNEIHLVLNYYDEDSSEYRNIYHMIFNITDGDMYSMNGTNLGVTVDKAEADSFCEVYDSETPDDETHACSLHLDGNGNPYLMYITRDDPTTGVFWHMENHWNSTTNSWRTTAYNITSTDHGLSSDFIIYSWNNITAFIETIGGSDYGGDVERWWYNGTDWVFQETILSEDNSGRPLNGVTVPCNWTLESIVGVSVGFGQYSSSFAEDLKVYAWNKTGFVVNQTISNSYCYFWVEISDDISSSSTTVYVYYGKSGVTTTSNGTNTFLAFDDFEQYSLGATPSSDRGWEVTDGDPLVQNNPAGRDGQGLEMENLDDTYDRIRLNWTALGVDSQTNVSVHYYWYSDQIDKAGYHGFREGATRVTDIKIDDTGDILYYDGEVWQEFNPVLDFDATTWYEFDQWLIDNSDYYMYVDGNTYDGGLRSTPAVGAKAFDFDTYGDSLYDCTWFIDVVYVWKFIQFPPTFSLWGDEELASSVSSGYQLEFEHQCLSADIDKDVYNVTVYGYSSGGDDEEFGIQMWDASTLSWGSVLGTISTALQWYNFTFDSSFVESDGTVTWRYIDQTRTPDSVQSTLHIDYAGIRYWNFTIDQFSDIDNADYKQGSGWELFDSMPLVITVTSGVNYNVEIRAVDGTGSPVANGYLRFDIDSDPIGGTNLTTTYQTVLTNQPLGIGMTHNIYIFCAVPFEVGDQTMTFTLYIRIVEY